MSDLYDTTVRVTAAGTEVDVPLAVYVDIEDLAQRLVEGVTTLVVALDTARDSS